MKLFAKKAASRKAEFTTINKVELEQVKGGTIESIIVAD